MLSELPFNEDIFIEKYLMEGIQDLCRKSQCFTEAIVGASTDGDPVHTLTATSAYSKVVKFLYGKYLNRTLENRTVGEMTHRNPQWETNIGTPNFIVYEGGNTIRWSKIPDTTGDSVEFTVSLIPTDIENSDVPRQIEDDHLETVKDYVKWKTYITPLENIFNERLAIYHEKRYERGSDKLKVSVLTGFSGNAQVQQVRFV